MKVIHFIALFIALFAVHCSCKKSIMNIVNICKRNDPQISECYSENFRKVLPLMTRGLQEMSLPSIDPVMIETISMDFTQSKSVKLVANLTEVTVLGISKGQLMKAEVKPQPEKLEIYLEMSIPNIQITSNYKGKGNFLLLAVDTVGNFTGRFDELLLKGLWIGEPFHKRNKLHLKWRTENMDLAIKHLEMHFTDLFPDQNLNHELDRTINDNLDSLYEEVKPVILETINSVTLNAINSLYDTFPYDVLFPID